MPNRSGLIATLNAAEVYMIAGPIIVTGFADGSFVKIARNEATYTLVVGTDGEACRSMTNNRSGTFEFTLGQWSSCNSQFSALLNTDEKTGDGIIPVMIKYKMSVYAAEKAWVQKPADQEYAREAGSRVWTLETSFLTMVDGVM